MPARAQRLAYALLAVAQRVHDDVTDGIPFRLTVRRDMTREVAPARFDPNSLVGNLDVWRGSDGSFTFDGPTEHQVGGPVYVSVDPPGTGRNPHLPISVTVAAHHDSYHADMDPRRARLIAAALLDAANRAEAAEKGKRA